MVYSLKRKTGAEKFYRHTCLTNYDNYDSFAERMVFSKLLETYKAIFGKDYAPNKPAIKNLANNYTQWEKQKYQ
jgi:hypothetical protein